MLKFHYWIERPNVIYSFIWKFDLPQNKFGYREIWIEAPSEEKALERFNEIKEYIKTKPLPLDLKVHFENGDYLTTKINATLEEATKYYVGNTFNVGLGPNDNMVKAVRIELI
jgi:hypothetical protein